MELHGKSVFGGIAMGRLSVYHKTDNAVKRTKITDIEAEKKDKPIKEVVKQESIVDKIDGDTFEEIFEIGKQQGVD